MVAIWKAIANWHLRYLKKIYNSECKLHESCGECKYNGISGEDEYIDTGCQLYGVIYELEKAINHA